MEVEAAETAYDFVGGRIVHLRLIVDALNAGRNFDGIPLLPKKDYLPTEFTGIKRKLLRDARAHVQGAQISLALAITTKGLK